LTGLPALNRLVASLGRLPGVGRRSAERMAQKLIGGGDLIDELVNALQQVRDTVTGCSRCGAATSVNENPCRFCTSGVRDETLVCVVEDPADIPLIESSGGFKGRYHALMGRLAPSRGEGPASLRVASLIERVRAEGIREVLLALGTDVEGEATSSYVCERLQGLPVRISRLAYGLPAGSAVRFSDPLTLARAIKGRQPLS
jgi:recombination protein RecR